MEILSINYNYTKDIRNSDHSEDADIPIMQRLSNNHNDLPKEYIFSDIIYTCCHGKVTRNSIVNDACIQIEMSYMLYW